MTSNGLIDLQSLKSMYGADSVQELVAMSMDEAGKLLESLARNIAVKDSAEVTRDAHQLKGMAATMTLTQIFELSRKLEKAAHDGQWEQTSTLLSEIQTAVHDLQAYLKSMDL